MKQELKSLLSSALTEDMPTTDITYDCILTENPSVKAAVIAKEDGIFYGEDIFSGLFSSDNCSFKLSKQDGDAVTTKDVIATITAPAKLIISRERVLLNLIQRLSGISTLTQAFVKALDNPNIDVLDTRKTTPGIRFLEKEAVVAGGGVNHRQNLSDMVLIKENHLSLLSKESNVSVLPDRLKVFKTINPNTLIEIEVESLEQIKTTDFTHIDLILLDNFSIKDVKEAIITCKEIAPHLKIECSGNVTLETIGNYRDLNIDRISVGSLTHSATALDLSLLIDYA
jgi:nicotinate-nucleotide pyrophosphorylase (carboxylating)